MEYLVHKRWRTGGVSPVSICISTPRAFCNSEFGNANRSLNSWIKFCSFVFLSIERDGELSITDKSKEGETLGWSSLIKWRTLSSSSVLEPFSSSSSSDDEPYPFSLYSSFRHSITSCNSVSFTAMGCSSRSLSVRSCNNLALRFILFGCLDGGGGDGGLFTCVFPEDEDGNMPSPLTKIGAGVVEWQSDYMSFPPTYPYGDDQRVELILPQPVIFVGLKLKTPMASCWRISWHFYDKLATGIHMLVCITRASGRKIWVVLSLSLNVAGVRSRGSDPGRSVHKAKSTNIKTFVSKMKFKHLYLKWSYCTYV